MAVILVPQDQPTVADAVSAAVSGDTISLAPGNHTVSTTVVRTGKTGVRFRSQDPSSPAVVLSSVAVFGPAPNPGWSFYDIIFRWSADWRVVSSSSNDSFYGCTINHQNRTVYSANTAVLSAGGATDTRHVVFRGCQFLGPTTAGVGSARAIYGTFNNTVASHFIVESCLFDRWNMELSQVIRVWAARAAGSSHIVRNNTFLNCERKATATGYIASNSTFGAGSTLEVTNNLIENASGLTGSSHVDIALVDPGSDNVWQLRNNYRRYPGFTTGNVPTFSTVGGSSAGIDGNVTSLDATAWLLGAVAWPVPGSPILQAGHPTMRARMDLQRRETALTVGAVQYVEAHPRLHVKWTRVPMLGGFQVSLGGSPVALPAVTYQSFDSPDDLALWLSRAVDTLDDIEVFYSQHGYYMIHATTSAVSVTTSGTARTLMGPVTEVEEDALYRTEEDANTLTLEQYLDEDVEADENHAFTLGYTGVGRVIVQPIPEGGRRAQFTFTVLSNRLDTDKFVSVMDRFSAGREMRVWRSLYNTEPRSLTNRLGYSDIVPESAEAMQRYDWYNPQRSRIEHVLYGVEVR